MIRLGRCVVNGRNGEPRPLCGLHRIERILKDHRLFPRCAQFFLCQYKNIRTVLAEARLCAGEKEGKIAEQPCAPQCGFCQRAVCRRCHAHFHTRLPKRVQKISNALLCRRRFSIEGFNPRVDPIHNLRFRQVHAVARAKICRRLPHRHRQEPLRQIRACLDAQPRKVINAHPIPNRHGIEQRTIHIKNGSGHFHAAIPPSTFSTSILPPAQPAAQAWKAFSPHRRATVRQKLLTLPPHR